MWGFSAIQFKNSPASVHANKNFSQIGLLFEINLPPVISAMSLTQQEQELEQLKAAVAAKEAEIAQNESFFM